MKIGKLVTGIVLAILAGVVCADGVMAQNMDSVEGDRRALADLYHATGGDKWKNNSGWLSGNPSNSWYGIEVDGNGRVVKVKLNGTGFGQDGKLGGNNLTGSLPESIGNLSKVTYFNVKQNKLTGQIPSSIGNMTSLVDLLLNGRVHDPVADKDHHPGKESGSGTADRSNNFTGSIPVSIGNLQRLQFFEATGKNIDVEGLSGSVPGEIGKLTNIIGLHLDFNSLTSLPNTLTELKELVHLGVSVNHLSGGIPETVKELESLRYFRIGKNEIGGTIPDLSMLTDLRIFSSTFNNLTGSIPSALTDGTLPKINVISLSWNNLEGELPEFGKANIAMFTIAGNNLHGEIPDVSNLRKVINFDVSRNNFEGEFPDMTHAYKLRYIRADNNNFSGPLPALHPNNKKLANLWFQNNNFSGPIDPSIAKAVKNGRKPFGEFNISNNRMCSKDLDGAVKSINSLGKKVTIIYGNQRDPICGNISSNANAQSMTGEEANASQQSNNDGSELNALPAETGLNQNYPNPFNPTTQIEYTLSDQRTVSLKVYDMAGRVVAVLADGVKQAGRHTATFRGDNLSSGIYFIRFMAGTEVYTKKMTLVK